MLIELKNLHRELLAAIAKLEGLVAAAEPDPVRLPIARAQLVNASARRRRWIDNHIYPQLVGRLTAEDARHLEALQQDNVELRARSNRHVADWTLDTIVGDWRGYSRASAEMTFSMRRRIAVEQALLYPLLDRLPLRPPAPGGGEPPMARQGRRESVQD